MCAYTTRLCGTLPCLHHLHRRCSCVLPHERLQGLAHFEQSDRRVSAVWKTTLAGRYPPRLCREVVRVARLSAPHGAAAKADESNPRPRWAAALGKAANGKPAFSVPLAPCPRHYRSEWADAVKVSLEGNSRRLREAALLSYLAAKGCGKSETGGTDPGRTETRSATTPGRRALEGLPPTAHRQTPHARPLSAGGSETARVRSPTRQRPSSAAGRSHVADRDAAPRRRAGRLRRPGLS